MDNWIPVREQLPENEEWVQAQTQNGTVLPAVFKNNQWYQWSSLRSSSLIEQLMQGKVAYWQPRAVGYAYVQCKCGSFYLQAEGRKTCPVCTAFGIEEKPKREPKKKKAEEEEIPFNEPPADNLEDMLI